MRPLVALALGGAGIALTMLVCAVLGVPVGEGTRLIAYSAGGATVVGLAGSLLLRALPRARFGTHLTVVTVAGVGSVAAGALASVQAMLLPSDDLHALVVVIVAAGSVGAVVAWTLAGQVRDAREALVAAARRLEDGGEVPDSAGADRGGAPPIREFAALAEDLERTRARLAASRRRERELDAARRELLTWLSHDLRTPLAGIRALTEALEDGVADDPATVGRYQRQLRLEAGRVSEMVEDLFALSRIYAGATEQDRVRVGLGDLVSDAVATVEAVARQRGVAVHGRVEEVVDVEVAPREAARVLDNLLGNAVRETPAGGEVEVAVTREGAEAVVTVADACGGIPDEVIDRVFEAGFRASPSRTADVSARGGYGLAIARGLAEAHGGRLSVANLDGGCEFRLRLPAASPATVRAEGDPAREVHSLRGSS